MPMTPDPSVGASLFTPRGYIPLAGANEETKPVNPNPPDLAPSPMDRTASAAFDMLSPIFGETTPAVISAFRESNTIGSAIAKTQEMAGVSNDLVDQSYGPWKDVVGTPYE